MTQHEAETQTVLKTTTQDLLSCCNKTSADIVKRLQDLSQEIQPKIEDLAKQTDVETLINMMTHLTNKSSGDDQQGTMEDLSTIGIIHNYTQLIDEKLKAIIEQLQDDVTKIAESTKTHITNVTTGATQRQEDHLSNIILDFDSKLQINTERLLKKLDTLSTFNDTRNITELIENLSAELTKNDTENERNLNDLDVQIIVDGLKQHLDQFEGKDYIANITNLIEHLATKESIDTLNNNINLQSEEETMNNTATFWEIKEDLLHLKGTLDDLPTSATVHSYTQLVDDKITNLVKQMKGGFTDLAQSTKTQITNLTSGLRQEQEYNLSNIIIDFDRKLQNNTEKLLEKLDTLSTYEDTRNITELIGNLSRKGSDSDTKNKTNLKKMVVQSIVDVMTQQLTHLAGKRDIVNITTLLESLATKESIDTLNDNINNLSEVETVTNAETISEIKKDLSALKGQGDTLREELKRIEKRLETRFETIIPSKPDSISPIIKQDDLLRKELEGMEERLLTRLETVILSGNSVSTDKPITKAPLSSKVAPLSTDISTKGNNNTREVEEIPDRCCGSLINPDILITDEITMDFPVPGAELTTTKPQTNSTSSLMDQFTNSTNSPISTDVPITNSPLSTKISPLSTDKSTAENEDTREGCPEGLFVATQCFTIHNSEKSTWADSKELCQSKGLVLPETSETVALILRRFLLERYGNGSYWLNAHGDGKSFEWGLGDMVLNNDLWEPVQPQAPNVANTDTYCLALSVNDEEVRHNQHLYHPYECSKGKHFTLCERILQVQETIKSPIMTLSDNLSTKLEMMNQIETTLNKLKSISQCDAKFTDGPSFMVEHQCFKILRARPMSWAQAKTECQKYGHLAQPTDPKAVRRYLVEKYGSSAVWLGALGTGSSVRWQSGARDTLSNSSPLWYPGLGPNNGRVSSNYCLYLAVHPSNMAGHPDQPYVMNGCSANYYPLCQIIVQ